MRSTSKTVPKQAKVKYPMTEYREGKKGEMLPRDFFASFLQARFSRKVVENRKILLFLGVLLDNIQKVTSIKCICHQAGLSQKRLCESFSRELQQSPYRFLINLRVLGAMFLICARLSAEEEICLKSIAQVLGFGSYAPFRRAFHRFAGLSPRQFCTDRKRVEIFRTAMERFLEQANNEEESEELPCGAVDKLLSGGIRRAAEEQSVYR